MPLGEPLSTTATKPPPKPPAKAPSGYSYASAPIDTYGRPTTLSEHPDVQYAMAQNAITQAQWGQTAQGYYDQFNNYTTPNYQLAQGDLQGNYANQMAGLAQNQAATGYNQQRADAMHGINARDYAATLGYLGQQGVFNQGDAVRARGNAGSLRALAQRQFGLGSDANTLAFTRQDQADRSSATARGAVISEGYRQAMTNNAKNRDIAQGETKLGLDRSNQGIDSGLADSLAGIDRNNASLANQRSQAGFDNQRSDADYQYTTKVNSSLAKEYGVTEAQLTAALQRGMQKLGLNYNQAQDALAQAIQNGNQAAVASYMQIASQSLQYAG